MYEWQKELIEQMTKFKGRGMVQVTGRNAGKSTLAAQALQRLWNDVMAKPIEALICDVGTIYGARYYTVEPIGGFWPDMEEWCLDTFGSVGDHMWGEKKAPKPGHRWYMNNRKFWFRDIKDRDWFVLRWNS